MHTTSEIAAQAVALIENGLSQPGMENENVQEMVKNICKKLEVNSKRGFMAYKMGKGESSIIKVEMDEVKEKDII